MQEKKHNKLTDSSKYTLRDWMLSHQQKGTLFDTAEHLTAAAQHDHRFMITVDNMRGMLESTGINLIKQRINPAANLAKQVQDQGFRISHLEATLNRTLEYMHTQGIAPPDLRPTNTELFEPIIPSTNQPIFCRRHA